MALRAQVLAEEPCCRVCRGGGTDDDIVDHVVSLAADGTDDRANLQRLCRRCSNAKTARESLASRRQGAGGV